MGDPPYVEESGMDDLERLRQMSRGDRPLCFAELMAMTYARSRLIPIPLDRVSGRPLLDRKTLRRPPQVSEITSWWDAWPDANVGLVTGFHAGLAVLVLKAEMAIVEEFVRRCGGVVPDTPIVKAHDSIHFYFAPPGEDSLAKRLPSGMSIKAEEDWVVAPGSTFLDGSHCTFFRTLHDVFLSRQDYEYLAEPPDWLLDPDCVAWLSAVILAARNTPPVPKPSATRNAVLPPGPTVWNGTNFSPRSTAELLGEPIPPIAWVWEPYIPEGGLVLLAGFMKTGKTTFAYPLIRAIAQGKDFLGYPTRQGGVLVLAVEEHPQDVRRRLEKFGVAPDDPVAVHTGPLDDSLATFLALTGHVRDTATRLVVLDTLPAFWGIEDENDNAKVGKAVRPWLKLARETGAAVLLVHHESKAGGERGRGIRGAGALFGLVDQALVLTFPPGASSTNKRNLIAHGRYSETPGNVVIELDGTDYVLVGTSPEAARGADADRILAMLPADEPWTVEQIVEGTGLPNTKRVREGLAILADRVVRTGGGVKGDPHRYRRKPHSILPSAESMGNESHGAY